MSESIEDQSRNVLDFSQEPAEDDKTYARRVIREIFGTDNVRYLTALPRSAKDIPEGWILVHNFRPGHVDRKLGAGGFRAWVQEPVHKVDPCDCGWCPRIKMHYNVPLGNDSEEN